MAAWWQSGRKGNLCAEARPGGDAAGAGARAGRRGGTGERGRGARWPRGQGWESPGCKHPRRFQRALDFPKKFGISSRFCRALLAGDRVTASWNAARPCAQHARASLLCAASLRRAAAPVQSPARDEHDEGEPASHALSLSAGAAGGHAACARLPSPPGPLAEGWRTWRTAQANLADLAD
eukprot:gene15944-biopygen10975